MTPEDSLFEAVNESVLNSISFYVQYTVHNSVYCFVLSAVPSFVRDVTKQIIKSYDT
jgi:hypothetical protein